MLWPSVGGVCVLLLFASYISSFIKLSILQGCKYYNPWICQKTTSLITFYMKCHILLKCIPRYFMVCVAMLALKKNKVCTPMFIAALFIIARTWKQPRCPSAAEWIRKLWYIYTMEYYSAIKKNTIESVLIRWMKLEPIIQSEVSQKEKHQYSILMHIYGI